MSKYCVPYFEYDPDEDGESEIGIACPVCGDPSDYCQDHNHWYCDDCNESLEINDNLDDPVWHCEMCDGGEPNPWGSQPNPFQPPISESTKDVAGDTNG